MKVYWIIAAGACGLIALYFAVQQEYDRAFIIAAIGSVIWFLGYRSQMKNLIAKEASEENVESDEDERM
jgi:hypothetical protein